MKVLLVSSSSGSHGGGEFYLRELAGALRGLGHVPVTWLSGHPQMDLLSESFQNRGLSVHRFDYLNTYHRRFRSLGAALDGPLQRRLIEQFNRSGADLIHLNLQCLEDGLDLIRAAGRSSLPAIATIHVTRSAKSLGARSAWLRDLVCGAVLRRSRLPLVGISRTSAEDLCEFIHGHRRLVETGRHNEAHQFHLTTTGPAPIYAVPNGVAAPVPADGAALRREYGIASDAMVLGVIARIEQQKNPLFLCRLLRELPESLHVVWVGDGRLRPALEQEIQEQKLAHRFHLPGWRTDATDFLSAMDVFVLPSLYEGLPLALLEAMSAGLPCVVSDVDGTRDAIQSGLNGFLCPVNDTKAWLVALMSLIQSANLRQSTGGAARTSYREHFSLDAMARRTVEVYEEQFQQQTSGPTTHSAASF